jgi:hypothetical protein
MKIEYRYKSLMYNIKALKVGILNLNCYALIQVCDGRTVAVAVTVRKCSLQCAETTSYT